MELALEVVFGASIVVCAATAKWRGETARMATTAALLSAAVWTATRPLELRPKSTAAELVARAEILDNPYEALYAAKLWSTFDLRGALVYASYAAKFGLDRTCREQIARVRADGTYALKQDADALAHRCEAPGGTKP